MVRSSNAQIQTLKVDALDQMMGEGDGSTEESPSKDGTRERANTSDGTGGLLAKLQAPMKALEAEVEAQEAKLSEAHIKLRELQAELAQKASELSMEQAKTATVSRQVRYSRSLSAASSRCRCGVHSLSCTYRRPPCC